MNPHELNEVGLKRVALRGRGDRIASWRRAVPFLCAFAPLRLCVDTPSFGGRWRSAGENAKSQGRKDAKKKEVLAFARWRVLLRFWAVGILGCPTIISAQAPLADLVFAVGTTARDSGNVDRAYIALGTSQPLLLAGKRFAVFGKAGDANAAGPFTQRGIMAQAADVATINARLSSAVPLGESVAKLGDALNVLLRRESGIASRSVPEKVLIALQTAANNASTAERLHVMARVHPGLALCLGEAFTEASAVLTTYEVREISPATGAPAQVVGRVTIAPNAPVVLPAPGRPFQLRTNHPNDDLVIRLRWGTPDALRRLSLLSYGYNLWRIPRATAETRGYHLTPPTRSQLRTVDFTQVNEAPVPVTKDYSTGTGAGAADDPADTLTYFFTDDRGRSIGLPAFDDGSEFYYFATARDILGRDGEVSAGGLARACRRVRPVAPTGLSVLNDVRVVPLGGGSVSNEQRLLVTWEQVQDVRSPVTHYWIYRWQNPAMSFTNDTLPLSNRVSVVAHRLGTNVNSYRDDGPGAPTVAGLANYWYTIRAVSQAACDPLLSPHSAPASAVLRQREGPDAATGRVEGSCGSPVVYSDQARNIGVPGLPAGRWHYRFVCTRRDAGIAWAQFYYSNTVSLTVEYFSPIYFPPDGERLEMDYSTLAIDGPHSIDVGCVVGTHYGRTSRLAVRRLEPAPTPNTRREASFRAGVVLSTAVDSSDVFYLAATGGRSLCVPAIAPTPDPSGTVSMRFDLNLGTPALVQASSNGVVWQDVAWTLPDANGVYYVSYPACLIGPLPQFRGCVANLPDTGDCSEHITGSAGGRVAPVRVRFRLTPRTREYRVYRQVDGGVMTLVSQGAAAYNSVVPGREIVWNDNTMPPSAAQLCYFVQLLDEHGNGSPMAFLGCREAKPEKLPRPVLSEPAAAGDSAQPLVALNWFCPTAGVHRFELRVRRADQAPSSGAPSGFAGSALVRNVLLNQKAIYAGLARAGGAMAQFSEGHYTPPVGSGFGSGPQFTFNAQVQAGVPYKIAVLGRDRQNNPSELSQEWDFTWTPPEPPISVKWPFRPLPPVGGFDDDEPSSVFQEFRPRVKAVLMTYFDGTKMVPDPRYPVGIRIADIPNPNDPPDTVGTTNLVFLYPDRDGRFDPNARVFRRQSSTASRAGDILLPIVVYRQQVRSPEFPTVSGDLTQVSPLIERIPWRDTGGNGTIIPDRLIAIMNENGDFACDCSRRFLYLRDSQPVMVGARYQYWVVRFNARREATEIINAGSVQIPTSF